MNNGKKPSKLPPPPINVFERLRATDGLLINAERWRRMHEYHRQRQNLHYQSLNQPGIVCGLGVRLIPAPMEILPRYRDNRWLEIQPGIAIDLVGNPIVIPQAIQFRIASEPATEAPLIVYLMVSYVDPETLHRQAPSDFVQETFRIDEKAGSPGDLEVELCRIRLQPGVVNLKQPTDVFFPGDNALDLRYRPQAQARPQATVRIAQVTHSDIETNEHIFGNLSYLLQSIAGLYPALQGALEPGQVTLQSATANGLDYDLLYMTRQQLLSLKQPEVDILKNYIETGGVLLLEASTKGTKIETLRAIRQELQEALAEIELSEAEASLEEPEMTHSELAVPEADELGKIRQELQAELEAIEADLEAQFREFCLICTNFAQQLETQLENLSRHHPLRIQPFLFAALPCLEDEPIQILTGKGIVLVVGDLSSGWGLDEDLALNRSTIRNAHEFGINILHFAWRRRQLTQVMQEGSDPSAQQQVNNKSVFDKLLE